MKENEDYEKVREAIIRILCKCCGGICDMEEGQFCDEVVKTTGEILALPMIGVIAKDQCADTIGELEWFKKGWRKLANMGTRPNQPADGL